MSASRSIALAPPRTPAKKQSMPEISATTTPLGRRPSAIGSLAQDAPISFSPPKSLRNSPGRGLTIQIENDMTRYSHSKSIQSAPVRAARRLPAPPPPFTSIPETPSTSFPICSPSTANSARAIRPLPCPPSLAANNAETLQAVSGLSPSSNTRRCVRPLPVPVPKAEPSLSILSQPKLALSLSQPSRSQLKPTSPPIPSPSVIATFPHPDTTPRRHHHTSSENLRPSKNKASIPRKLQISRSHADLHRIDVVQLHKQFVVNRKPSYMSSDSDNTSEDEYSEESCTSSMIVLGAGQPHTTVISSLAGETKDGKDLHATDYAWRLTNRIIDRQKSPEARVTSKWVRERNGKRLTEDDFNSIMQSLRSL